MADAPAFQVLLPPEKVTPHHKLTPNLKLQIWYRKSFEYRSAHALAFTAAQRSGDRLSLASLAVSNLVSLLLLLRGSDAVVTVRRGAVRRGTRQAS
eukprot:2879947-Pyramimonas_sp.AAC.1